MKHARTISKLMKTRSIQAQSLLKISLFSFSFASVASFCVLATFTAGGLGSLLFRSCLSLCWRSVLIWRWRVAGVCGCHAAQTRGASSDCSCPRLFAGLGLGISNGRDGAVPVPGEENPGILRDFSIEVSTTGRPLGLAYTVAKWAFGNWRSILPVSVSTKSSIISQPSPSPAMSGAFITSTSPRSGHGKRPGKLSQSGGFPAHGPQSPPHKSASGHRNNAVERAQLQQPPGKWL